MTKILHLEGYSAFKLRHILTVLAPYKKVQIGVHSFPMQVIPNVMNSQHSIGMKGQLCRLMLTLVTYQA